jgi:hypothetical protein
VGKAAKVIKLERKAGAAAAARAAAAEEKVAESGALAAAAEEKAAARVVSEIERRSGIVLKPGWEKVKDAEVIGEKKILSHSKPEDVAKIDRLKSDCPGSSEFIQLSNGELQKVNYYDGRGYLKYQYECREFDKLKGRWVEAHIHEYVITDSGTFVSRSHY